MSMFKKILCAVDFSDASCRALSTAAQLAAESSAELSVVYVEPPAEMLTPVAGLAPDAEDEVGRQTSAIASLRILIDDYVPPSIATVPLVKSGKAATEIVRAAEQEKSDLVVLSTHGGRGWQPGILGTVAAEVLSTAPCAVLSLSTPAEEKITGERGTKEPSASTDSLRPALRVVSSHGLYLDGD